MILGDMIGRLWTDFFWEIVIREVGFRYQKPVVYCFSNLFTMYVRNVFGDNGSDYII